MTGLPERERDLASLGVPTVGAVRATGDGWAPYELVDVDGLRVGPVAAFPEWNSKLQGGCRGRERPRLGPDSRRAAYGRWLRV